MLGLMLCPDDHVLAAYVASALPEARRQEVEDHATDCNRCSAALATFVELFVSGGEQTHPKGDPATPPGTAVGRFLILEEVGRGAMGIVYAAYDPELDRKVALKVLKPNSGVPPHLRSEARAMARLVHPNVVTVLDVGTEPSAFVVMEFVTGQTLRAWLSERPRSTAEIVAVFVGAGRGLAAAHDAGIVHRDFKPDNVLVDADGHARVTDFGLARLCATDDAFTGGAVGTPAYMAPEQLDEDAVSPAADQFAWCVTLFEALYGQRPFPQNEILGRLDAIRSGRIAAPSTTPRPVPGRLRRALERGMAAQPEDRFPTMHALLREVATAARPRRRAALVAAIAMVGVAAGAAVALGNEPSCIDPEAALQGVWDDAAAARLRKHYDEAGAGEVTGEVITALDARAAAWRSAVTDHCARQDDETTDPAVNAVRAECLRRRNVELEAMVQGLTVADPRTLQRSLPAVEGLPAVKICDEPSSRLTAEHEVLDASTRAEVADLRAELARAAGLDAAGQPRAARDIAAATVPRARAVDHAPVLAESLIAVGKLEGQLSNVDDALAMLREAARICAASSDHQMAVSALLAQIDLLDDGTHYSEIRGLGEVAMGHAEATEDPMRQREVLIRLGYNERNAGNYTEAERVFDAAAALSTSRAAEMVDAFSKAMLAVDRGRIGVGLEVFGKWAEMASAVYGPHHPNTAFTLHNHAVTLCAAGQFEDALAAYAQSRAASAVAYGDDDPRIARAHLAESACALRHAAEPDIGPHLDTAERILAHADGEEASRVFAAVLRAGWRLEHGDAAAAHAAYVDAVARAEALVGKDHPSIGDDAVLFAAVLLRVGDASGAIEPLRRAVRIYARALGADEPRTAAARALLGTALARAGQAEEARTLLDGALAILDPVPGFPDVKAQAVAARAALDQVPQNSAPVK